MNSIDIRDRFVNYYQNLGFKLLPRATMLHDTIPMSFVMSAGLVQVESSLAQINQNLVNRYVLIQKCFRHFDLDRVGQDDIHLSLFEMPGAFIFDENAKEQAIELIPLKSGRPILEVIMLPVSFRKKTR